MGVHVDFMLNKHLDAQYINECMAVSVLTLAFPQLNATSSTGTSNSTIRSVFGGTVCHSPVSRPPISASKVSARP